MNIQEGDIVSVSFMNAQKTLAASAEVLHVPRGRGDSWIFRDTTNGAIHYVSEPCTVSKVTAAEGRE